MASVQSSEKLRSILNCTMYNHDPADATTATDIAWVDMRDYGRILIGVMANALTGNGVTAFKILANSASDGSGTDAEVKVHALGSAPDAAGDYLWLECTAEEIRSVETSSTGELRYVSANIDCHNGADTATVVYIRAEPRFPQTGLTADYVSA